MVDSILGLHEGIRRLQAIEVSADFYAFQWEEQSYSVATLEAVRELGLQPENDGASDWYWRRLEHGGIVAMPAWWRPDVRGAYRIRSLDREVLVSERYTDKQEAFRNAFAGETIERVEIILKTGAEAVTHSWTITKE